MRANEQHLEQHLFRVAKADVVVGKGAPERAQHVRVAPDAGSNDTFHVEARNLVRIAA